MLLHDTFFLPSNESINATHTGTVTIAYSPLFHSTFTLIISIFGLIFNLICTVKIWSVIHQYRVRKLSTAEQSPLESIHILSHKKYRFLFILTSNDFILCFSSIISCLDEKYFFQSFLARHHLCAAHVLLWKFTLHFIPLLSIGILCRYHYMLSKQFQAKSSNLSTYKQLLYTDLCILIPLVLAIAWSVDGLWLWGVANIKDFIGSSSSSSPSVPSSINIADKYSNRTMEILQLSSIYENNTALSDLNSLLTKSEEKSHNNHYLMEQKSICYLQTNHNFRFTVRLVHLIQADFLLLFCLHLLGLVLEVLLHIRLSCCIVIKKITASFNHERQICICILYTFITVTLTSLPFYFYRAIEIVFDTQLVLINSDIINSRLFSQILLLGTSFKPVLFFILFFPSSTFFKFKFYLTCYSSTNIQGIEQNEQLLPLANKSVHSHERRSSTLSPRHRYSLFTHSSHREKSHPKLRTQSHPILMTNNHHRSSSVTPEQFSSWLNLSHSIIINNNNNGTSITKLV